VSSGVTDPTPGNNSATDTDTLNPSADVAITKTDGATVEIPGSPVTYTIVASNPSGPSAAPSVTVADTFAAILTGCSTTCVAAGGASCVLGPIAGNLNTVANLPVGGTATYTATCNIDIHTSGGTLVNTATATVGGGVADPVPGNNSATDTDTLDTMPFVDSFETGNTSRWSNVVPLTFEEYAAIALTAGSADVGFAYDFSAVVAGSELAPTRAVVVTDAEGRILSSLVARRTAPSAELELSLEVTGSAGSNWVTAGEVAQQVRIEWVAASASGPGYVAVYLDGRLALWVDGFSPVGAPSGVKLLRAPAPPAEQ
jgi:hypothetical protein